MKRSLAAVSIALCFAFGPAFAAGDFNGDLRADVLWRHHGAGGTGQNYIYPMDGTQILGGEGYVRTVADMNWEVVGIGDFDGNGDADILWRNQATGENYVYFMLGTTIADEGYIRAVTDLNWKVAAIGDFDGDGASDILWRNAATGENYVYPMSGLSIKGTEGYLRTVPDQNWEIVGTGRFDGNTMSDMLWRNRATGQNYIYFMSGITIENEGYIRTVADANWKVAGVGDLDGDGKHDIVWRNAATGENYVYPMDGLNIKVNEGYLRTVADRNWQIVGVGNYDGNATPATADILWRNVSTGENYLYPMSGTAILPSEGYVRRVADRDWQVQPASRCPAISSGAIALSVVPTRTSGVAPLAVVFDATGTTATATTRPFHELDYQWNFGDDASGFWSATPEMPNLRRNVATGPIAAHVFEKPGTYTVCVTAFDGASTETTSVQITVTDPNTVFSGTNTRCIRSQATGTFDGCPSGASQLTSSDFDAVVASNIGAGRRLLFRRGDTFTASTAAVLNVAGPISLGAFGGGAKPLVEISGGGDGIKFGNQDDAARSDYRVMDLEIDGNSNASTRGVYVEGRVDFVTLLRVDIHHVHIGLHMSPFIADAFNHPTLWDGWVMQDSSINTVIGGSGGNGLYIGAQRFALLGNVLSDSTGAEHILRTPNVVKGVISHNDMNNPASAKHVIKLQAAVFDVSPTGFTEQIVIADNKFTAGSGAAWNVTLGPQDSAEDERVRNVIVERNWFAPHAGQQVALLVWAQDVTVRNNVFNLTGTSDHRGMIVDQRGIEPPPSNVHVYNNTFYSNSTGNFIPVQFATGAGMVVKNNLGYAPSSTSRDMVSGTATNENNTTDAGILQSPGFVSGTPSLPTDFALGPASSALNAGTTVPVFSDLARRSRPQQGLIDRGAFERP